MSEKTALRRVLIAIGGNALFDTENGNNIDPTRLNQVCQQIVKVVVAGYQPIITFGNGPQVGNLLEMSESFVAPPKWPIPLDVCVAWTQGEMGYVLSKTLVHMLGQAGVPRQVVAVNTTVEVDLEDPAFLNPTKYVGNFYTEAEAKALSESQGWQIKKDSNRGFRRVVPSPYPLHVLELESLEALIETGAVVLCGGGGGIPVAQEEGVLRGVEAVIDKDFTACLLASGLEIPDLLICTGVDNVYLHYGEPEQKALDRVTVTEAKAYIDEGHFPAGSMGPKVKALVQFLEAGGQRAMMTRLERVVDALMGLGGTRFVPDIAQDDKDPL